MKKKLSLTNTIIAITSLTLIALSSTVGYLEFSRANKHNLLQAYDYMDNITEMISQGINNLIDEKIKILTLAREEFLSFGKIHKPLLDTLIETFDEGLAIIDEKGIIKDGYSKHRAEALGADISYREYFIQTKKTLKPYVSGSFKAIFGKDVVVITVPIIKDNRFAGLIAGFIGLSNQRISYLISHNRFYRTGNVVVIDDKGIVLFSEDPTEVGKFFDRFPIDSIGYREIEAGNKRYLVGIGPIPNTRWKIIASIEKDDILQHSYENLRYGSIVSILISTLSLIILLLTLKGLLLSLNILRDTAIEYGKGNYNLNTQVSSFREINDIINAFSKMSNEIRERELRIKEEQTYLEALLVNMGEGVFVVNSDKKIEFVNKRLLEMLGYTEEELFKLNPVEIFAPSYREKMLDVCFREERLRERVELVSKDGKNIPVLCSASFIRLNNSIEKCLVLVTDLSEIEEREKELQDALEEIRFLNEELTARSQQLEIALAQLDMRLFEVERAKEDAERLAIIDPLTGLFNRRYLEERLNKELTKAKAYNFYISFLMADIDHFKRINDTYGHNIGDEVLKSLAVIFRANIRENDIVARYGGEEFVMVLTNVSKYDAYRIAERIRLEIQDTSFEEIGIPERITVSFGVSSFPEDGEEYSELLIKADQALYQAKSLGRNKVEVYTKPTGSIHF